MHRISVIMPCHNGASHLQRGVDSVLKQTYGSVELIVVNDGSTDDSLEILTGIRDDRLKIISQSKQGVSAARNRGLTEATGAFVAFLDADDTWHPDCLAKLVAALKDSPDAVLSYCGWQNLGVKGGGGEPYIPPDYENEGKLEHLLRCCPWPIHAALVRRESVCETGGFPIGIKHAEDYYVWIRIAARKPVVRVTEVLAYYHFGASNQASRNRAAAVLGSYRVKKEFLRLNPDLFCCLPKQTINTLLFTSLIQEGLSSYWHDELDVSHALFREILFNFYKVHSFARYLIPALLPLRGYRFIIKTFRRMIRVRQ